MDFNKKMKYKELVEQLGLEWVEGGHRVRQLEKLRKEYEIEKEGTYYTIIRKLDEIEIIRKKSYLTLKDYMVPIIYSFIKTEIYTETMTMSRNKLLKDLCLINDNFYYANEFPYESATIISSNLDGNSLYRYTEAVRKMLNQALTSTLEELSNDKIANVTKHKMRTIQTILPNGTVVSKNVILTEEQEDMIFLAEGRYLTEKKIKSWDKLSYFDLKEAHDKISKEVGFNYFEGFRFKLNQIRLEDYVVENHPTLIKSLNELVEEKLIKTKRKNIGSVPLDTRMEIIKTLHSMNPVLNLEEAILGLDNL